MPLPRFIGIQSEENRKYLWYTKGDGDVGFLSFTGPEIVSPYSKFEVEPSRNRKGLVHIRCCYNNRYWAKDSEEGHLLVAGYKQKDEDESKWSCTLFQPLKDEGKNTQTISLRHMHSNRKICSRTDLKSYRAELCLKPEEEDETDYPSFFLVDWDTLVIFPKCVTFKGHDGKYIGIYIRDNNPYVIFADGDIGDTKLWNEVVTRSNGSVCIKSKVNDKFWQTVYAWIRASADWSSTEEKDSTWFWPVKVDSQIIALRNYHYNNLFCARDPAEGWPDGFSADSQILTMRTQVIIEEPVIVRKIYNVDYRLTDARIYNDKVINLASEQVTNQTKEYQTTNVELRYSMTKINMWARNSTFNTGIKTSFQAAVPFIYDGEVLIWDDFSGELDFGETKKSSTELIKSYKVDLAPKTKVTISLWATKGSCDVPFSYTQRDTMTDGQFLYYNMDDGLYTGTNIFNFKFQTKIEPFECEMKLRK